MATTQRSALTIRRATVADAAAISALGASVFTATFGHSVTPEQLAKYLDEAYSVPAVLRDITDQDKDFWVSTAPDTTTTGTVDADAPSTSPAATDATRGTPDERGVTGFVLLNRSSSEPCISHLPRAIELQRLYVRGDCHGLGIGSALARHVEDWARGQGFEHMWLGVWEENVRAQRVYAKLGYERVGEHVFDFGGDLQTDWILVKPLR